jgi:hypothetical protein
MLSITCELNKPILHTHSLSLFMSSLVVAWLPPSLGVAWRFFCFGAHALTGWQLARN